MEENKSNQVQGLADDALKGVSGGYVREREIKAWMPEPVTVYEVYEDKTGNNTGRIYTNEAMAHEYDNQLNADYRNGKK